MVFQIFQIDSLLKHSFPSSTPLSLQPFPIWQHFQSISSTLFLLSEHITDCLYLLLKGTHSRREILHMKSSQNLGDQN